MKKRIVSLLIRVLLLIVFILSMTGTASAAAPSPLSFDGRHTWTLRPLNKTPNDPLNIQRAVDLAKNGDRIILTAGVFNFGDFESVSVYKDLTIEGAWDNLRKKPLTTIKGGSMPLLIGLVDRAVKPAKMTVNGHTVWHITKDEMGKAYFPFLYPPYYEMDAMTWVQQYDLTRRLVPVQVVVRQITFLRSHHASIFVASMRGGGFERCQFISGWPLQSNFWGSGPGVMVGIQMWNLQVDMGWASGMYPLPDFPHGSDYLRGAIFLRDSVFEADYAEAWMDEKDTGGHVIFAPFDGNNPPPGNDYANYVVQDTYANPYMFFFNPETDPVQYWVRKGYQVFLTQVGEELVPIAERGQGYGILPFGSEMNLTIKNNRFHNYHMAVNDDGPNGQNGVPLNLVVENNTITTDIHSMYDDSGVFGVFSADYYGGSPGTNVTIKNNTLDINFWRPDNTGGVWMKAAIDVEVTGQVVISGNKVKTSAESGIMIWGPTQNALVKDNWISGTGAAAFLSGYSYGSQFINNHVEGFIPSGRGVYDVFGWGWPPYEVPAARGILYSSDSNLVQGTGTPGPLDIVYDCGSDNTIINMTAMACPAASAAPAPMAAQTAQARVKPVLLGKDLLNFSK